MSLVKLLAVGRSLGAVKDYQSRYRMRWPNPLPKFGGRAEVRESEKAGKRESELLVPARLSPIRSPGVPTETAEATTAETVFSGKSYPEHSIAPVLNRQSSSGTRLWNPWAVLKSRLTRRRPTRGAGEPVQAELALDMVRPVCNDLSDTDLEIVAREVKAPETAAAEAGGRAKLRWARMTRPEETVSRP